MDSRQLGIFVSRLVGIAANFAEKPLVAGALGAQILLRCASRHTNKVLMTKVPHSIKDKAKQSGKWALGRKRPLSDSSYGIDAGFTIAPENIPWLPTACRLEQRARFSTRDVGDVTGRRASGSCNHLPIIIYDNE